MEQQRCFTDGKIVDLRRAFRQNGINTWLCNKNRSERRIDGLRVYISGAMANRPDTYKQEFERVEKVLKKHGHVVINPAVLPKGLNHTRYMPICLAMVDASDIVFMMKGWGDSKGARLEHDYAIYQEKIILYEERSENGVSNQIFTD